MITRAPAAQCCAWRSGWHELPAAQWWRSWGQRCSSRRMAVIDARHQNRVLFAQLQQLRQHRDQMNIEWGQLLLEQSTWSTHAYIEQSATQKLGMEMPQTS